MNVLIVVGELDGMSELGQDFIAKDVFQINRADYFEIVSCLYLIGSSADYNEVRTKVELRILHLLKDCNIAESSQHAHLALDVLTCPHLSIAFRRKVLEFVRIACSMPAIVSNVEKDKLIREMEKRPWFVRWSGLDLLNMIRKKGIERSILTVLSK